MRRQVNEIAECCLPVTTPTVFGRRVRELLKLSEIEPGRRSQSSEEIQSGGKSYQDGISWP